MSDLLYIEMTVGALSSCSSWMVLLMQHCKQDDRSQKQGRLCLSIHVSTDLQAIRSQAEVL